MNLEEMKLEVPTQFRISSGYNRYLRGASELRRNSNYPPLNQFTCLGSRRSRANAPAEIHAPADGIPCEQHLRPKGFQKGRRLARPTEA